MVLAVNLAIVAVALYILCNIVKNNLPKRTLYARVPSKPVINPNNGNNRVYTGRIYVNGGFTNVFAQPKNIHGQVKYLGPIWYMGTLHYPYMGGSTTPVGNTLNSPCKYASKYNLHACKACPHSVPHLMHNGAAMGCPCIYTQHGCPVAKHKQRVAARKRQLIAHMQAAKRQRLAAALMQLVG